jgi:hypothetical protein
MYWVAFWGQFAGYGWVEYRVLAFLLSRLWLFVTYPYSLLKALL